MTDQPWHPGEPTPAVLARAQRLVDSQAPGHFPRLGDGRTGAINFLEAYAQLAAVSMARAEYYGWLLERQREDAAAGELDNVWASQDSDATATGLGGPESAAGLIGYTYTASTVSDGGRDASTRLERVATGEEIRALVALEERERDRAAKLIKDAVGMGVSLQQVEVIRSYAGTISAALQTMVGEIGLSLDDAAILRAAQRSALAARRAMGQDDGSPDEHIGPPLSPGERVHALRAALARAEGELAELPAGG